MANTEPASASLGFRASMAHVHRARTSNMGGQNSLRVNSGILEGVTVPGMNFTTEKCSSVFLSLLACGSYKSEVFTSIFCTVR